MRLMLREIRSILSADAPLPAAATAPDIAVTGYSIDSRTLQPGNLFFALPGRHTDGAEFAATALAAGAAGAVVGRDRLAEFTQDERARIIGVPDTLGALQTLAANVRTRWGGPLVAITGSTGKTTTKQMIAELLGTRHRVVHNKGNFNNHIGLPLSLLRLEPETDVGVFELGMSAAGEICRLAEIARPDVGVVTNVGPAHLEAFESVDAIALAKRELVESIGQAGWAVLNADDARVAAFAGHCGGNILTYGIDAEADLVARELRAEPRGGYSFRASLTGSNESSFGILRPRDGASPPRKPSSGVGFTLSMVGRHNVSNLLAALGVAHLFGLPLDTLNAAVTAMRSMPMRGELIRLGNGALVVNDCYNSSPSALTAMLEAVAEIPARRRVAVLGGMMELGPSSRRLHQECGSKLAALGFSLLLTVGDAARDFADGAAAAGFPDENCMHCDTPAEAGRKLGEILAPEDVVLLKASRAVRLEGVWQQLGGTGAADELREAQQAKG